MVHAISDLLKMNGQLFFPCSSYSGSTFDPSCDKGRKQPLQLVSQPTIVLADPEMLNQFMGEPLTSHTTKRIHSYSHKYLDKIPFGFELMFLSVSDVSACYTISGKKSA